MAKQTFSVGQVLTAAQMTSLQQTAMLGGSATAKTASYTLVAADAGTVVSVNSTSATTITVNTGLFSAGDTVTIQNWGSGAVTITAGTATVNTAGSLIVPQYDGGVLYFTSASAAIYFDFVQAGAVSPLTTKGDLYTFSTSDARLPVGTNGYILVADSAEATGLKWAAAGGGGKVLQVVNATYSTIATSSTSTFVDSGLTATITPTLATSKILVIAFLDSQKENTSWMKARLLRGATSISTINNQVGYTNTTATVNVGSVGITYQDSPATTSATTYKVQFASASNNAIVVAQADGVSSITLMEIGA